MKHNALNISDGYNSGTDNSLFFYYIRTCKKRIAYFASCNQIHKTHYENGWYHILSQQKDSIAEESIVTVKDFVSLRMDSDENGTCVIVGQISKHKLKKWAKETEKAIGKHIAFVLDDTVITNPKVNARIENGVFQISLPHGYEFKKHI